METQHRLVATPRAVRQEKASAKWPPDLPCKALPREGAQWCHLCGRRVDKDRNQHEHPITLLQPIPLPPIKAPEAKPVRWSKMVVLWACTVAAGLAALGVLGLVFG
jgi:hypothetical protein